MRGFFWADRVVRGHSCAITIVDPSRSNRYSGSAVNRQSVLASLIICGLYAEVACSASTAPDQSTTSSGGNTAQGGTSANAGQTAQGGSGTGGDTSAQGGAATGGAAGSGG